VSIIMAMVMIGVAPPMIIIDIFDRSTSRYRWRVRRYGCGCRIVAQGKAQDARHEHDRQQA